MRRKSFRRALTLCLSLILFGLLLLGLTVYLKSTGWNRKNRETCPHETWINGECAFCGFLCPHDQWEEGQCTACGMRCRHDWTNGSCLLCGMSCEHPSFTGEVCDVCGFRCIGHHYEDGVCNLCGSRCEHAWSDGVCGRCGMVCPHENHDPDSGECPVCGSTVCHRFHNGVCSCGAKPEIHDGLLPPEYYEPCLHPGRVERVSYSQKLLAYGGYEVQKNMNVYLPYGYDSGRQYDVLILIHGGWDDENSWMTNEYDADGLKIVMKNIYDNMMDRKRCEPMIIVCPTTYNEEGWEMDSGYDGFAQELRETVLPYVADHYSTYAASGRLEDLRAARAHFAVGGESNGSLYTLHSGMLRNFDLFGRFICLSGNNLAPWEVDDFIQTRPEGCPFEFFFAGAGTLEEYRDYISEEYRMLLDRIDDLKEGENAWYDEAEGYHEFRVWATEIFYALQMLFC
ncbi:MAG: hypothetical protein II008_00125 [Oscillospiraceae bacterium]|nr:hypothetical protein [Oscillospiraceae bacterium]